MTELSEISDRDLHRERRRRNKLRKQRSRKAHGLPQRKKGMGVRIGDRDEAEKVRRGYVEAGSFVRNDGSEKLVGRDWRMRVGEVAERSGGRCEHIVLVKGEEPERCARPARDPDHIEKRSKRRDDRASNIKHLCAMHHYLKHPEFRPQWSKK